MGSSNISSPGLQPSTRLSNLGSTETLEETSSGSQDKPAPSSCKHLTVEELFGTCLPKEQPTAMGLESEDTDKLLGNALQKEPSSFIPFSFEPSGGPPQFGNLGVHSAAHPTVQPEVSAPVLITPASIAQLGDKHPPNSTLPLSPVFSPTLPAEAPTTQVLHLPENSTMMQAVKTTPRQKSPLLFFFKEDECFICFSVLQSQCFAVGKQQPTQHMVKQRQYSPASDTVQHFPAFPMRRH
jgi:mRNA-decapping enzyme 1A